MLSLPLLALLSSLRAAPAPEASAPPALTLWLEDPGYASPDLTLDAKRTRLRDLRSRFGAPKSPIEVGLALKSEALTPETVTAASRAGASLALFAGFAPHHVPRGAYEALSGDRANLQWRRDGQLAGEPDRGRAWLSMAAGASAVREARAAEAVREGERLAGLLAEHPGLRVRVIGPREVSLAPEGDTDYSPNAQAEFARFRATERASRGADLWQEFRRLLVARWALDSAAELAGALPVGVEASPLAFLAPEVGWAERGACDEGAARLLLARCPGGALPMLEADLATLGALSADLPLPERWGAVLLPCGQQPADGGREALRALGERGLRAIVLAQPAPGDSLAVSDDALRQLGDQLAAMPPPPSQEE